MVNINLVSISPSQLVGNDHTGSFDLGLFEQKYLAQGDSWFSIGHIPPWATGNLLQQMVLSRSCVAVNCAHPGWELAHMTDTTAAQDFLNQLNGNVASRWNAILISGGGNDLIDAANAKPEAPVNARLLLNPLEWLDPTLGVARYLSAAGWTTFTDHMEAVLMHLLEQRDKASTNRDVPLFLHTYDYVTVRNAPAGLGLGPWLYKAMHDLYRIPMGDWDALADELINRMAAMWQSLSASNAGRQINVVDTRGTTTRALPGTSGASNDWQNEIHPTPHGYALLGARWRAQLDLLA